MFKSILTILFVFSSAQAMASNIYGNWSGNLDYSGSNNPAEVNLQIAECAANTVCIFDFSGWFYLPTSMTVQGSNLFYQGLNVGMITNDSMSVAYLREDGTNYTFSMVANGNGSANIKDQAIYSNGAVDTLSGIVVKSKVVKNQLVIPIKRRGLQSN